MLIDCTFGIECFLVGKAQNCGNRGGSTYVNPSTLHVFWCRDDAFLGRRKFRAEFVFRHSRPIKLRYTATLICRGGGQSDRSGASVFNAITTGLLTLGLRRAEREIGDGLCPLSSPPARTGTRGAATAGALQQASVLLEGEAPQLLRHLSLAGLRR